jgi:hypothetical protein
MEEFIHINIRVYGVCQQLPTHQVHNTWQTEHGGKDRRNYKPKKCVLWRGKKKKEKARPVQMKRGGGCRERGRGLRIRVENMLMSYSNEGGGEGIGKGEEKERKFY